METGRKTIGPQSATKVEYELQHFNFCTDEIIAENRELVKFLIQSTYFCFSKEFVKKYKFPEEEGEKLVAGSYMASLQMYKECGPKLDEISQLYRTTFTIPDSILLPSDLIHRKNYTAEQLQSLETEVKALEQQIRQDGVFLSMLEEEIKLHKRLAPYMEEQEKLLDLVDQHRQQEIVPAEDSAIVEDLADVMKDVMTMK